LGGGLDHIKSDKGWRGSERRNGREEIARRGKRGEKGDPMMSVIIYYLFHSKRKIILFPN